MNSFTFKLSPILLAIVGGAALSVNGFAADVYLSDFDKLNNGGFEQGNQAIKPGDTAACPLGWICGGSPSPGATAYQPTALEFPAASNGLFQPPSGGPRINPSGSWSALCPTLIEGSCILSQAKIGGLKYAAGTTYHLSLWLGTPKVMPFDRYGNVDDKTPTGRAQRITFYWVGNGNGQLHAVDLAAPPPGMWINYPLTFTPTGSHVGQDVGIMIFANSGNNYQPVVFDIDIPL